MDEGDCDLLVANDDALYGRFNYLKRQGVQRGLLARAPESTSPDRNPGRPIPLGTKRVQRTVRHVNQ